MQYFGSTHSLNSQEVTMYLGRNNMPKKKIACHPGQIASSLPPPLFSQIDLYTVSYTNLQWLWLQVFGDGVFSSSCLGSSLGILKLYLKYTKPRCPVCQCQAVQCCNGHAEEGPKVLTVQNHQDIQLSSISTYLHQQWLCSAAFCKMQAL